MHAIVLYSRNLHEQNYVFKKQRATYILYNETHWKQMAAVQLARDKFVWKPIPSYHPERVPPSSDVVSPLLLAGRVSSSHQQVHDV